MKETKYENNRDATLSILHASCYIIIYFSSTKSSRLMMCIIMIYDDII